MRGREPVDVSKRGNQPSLGVNCAGEPIRSFAEPPLHVTTPSAPQQLRLIKNQQGHRHRGEATRDIFSDSSSSSISEYIPHTAGVSSCLARHDCGGCRRGGGAASNAEAIMGGDGDDKTKTVAAGDFVLREGADEGSSSESRRSTELCMFSQGRRPCGNMEKV